jgi:hypothetical protein
MTELQTVALGDVIDVLAASSPATPVTTDTTAISYEHPNGGL